MMARFATRAIWIAALILVVLGSVPFWAPPFIDWNSQRHRLERVLTDATGTNVRIKGDITVASLLPSARISISGIEALSNVRDKATGITIDRIDVAVEAWRLLEGVLDVTSLRVEGPHAVYAVDDLGRQHWLERNPEGEQYGAEGRPPAAPNSFIEDVRLADVQISNGDVLYDNELTRQTLHATKLNLRATLETLADPLKLSGELDLNERPVVLTAALNSPKSLVRGEDSHATLKVTSALLQADIDLETWISPHLGANGTIDVQAPDVGELAQWLDRPLEQAEDPGALRLSGGVATTETKMTLRGLTLSGNGWTLTSQGTVDFGQVPTRVTFDIKGDRVDLDRYLPAPAEAPRRVRLGTFDGAPPEEGFDEPIDLTLLDRFQGDVRIALDELKVRDVEIGPTVFQASLKDKTLTVKLDRLELYGGRLSGQMTVDASGPQPLCAAKLAIDRVDVNSLFESRAGGRFIGGQMSGTIDVTSHGPTPRDLIEALAGSVTLELDPSDESKPARRVISKANLQLLIPEKGENPYLLGRLFYEGKQVSFDIETAPLAKVLSGKGFGLDATLKTDLATLRYKGDVYRSPILSLNGDLDAAVPSAGRLADWLGSPLPKDPGPVSLKASFESDGTTGRITEAHLTGKDLEAQVSGDFDFSGSESRFNLQVKTGVLRVDRYLPLPSPNHSEGQPDQSPERQSVLLLDDVSDAPLDLSALQHMKGDVEIASDGLVLRHTVVGSVAVGFHVDDGLARLDIRKLSINRGVVSGQASFDGRRPEATAALDLRGERIDLDGLAKLAGEDGVTLGTGDISITAKTEGSSLRDLVTNLAPVMHLDVAAVALNDHQALDGVALEARCDGLTKPFQLTGRGTFRTGENATLPVAVELTSDPISELLNNERFAVQGSGTLGRIRVQANADVHAPLTRAEPKLEVHSAGNSLEDFAPIFGAALPKVGPYKVAMRVTPNGAKTELSDLDLTLGRSRATGQLSFDVGKTRPAISGQISFAALDLTEFYGGEGGEDKNAGQSQPSASGDRTWIFPETPLPFELLSDVDISDLKVTIGKLKADPDVVIRDISTTAVLTDGTLHLSDLNGRIYDGDVSGSLQARDGAGTPSVDVALTGTNLDYGVFLKAFDITNRVRGRLDLALKLHGNGASLRGLASGLDGRIDLNARDGQIDRQMLGFLAFGTGSILDPLLGKKDTGKLKCIVTSFEFQGGLGKSLVNYYETSFFAMAGDGEIDLKTETLDFVFDPKAREISLMQLAVPFRVSGPLQSPKVDVDATGTLIEAFKTAGTIAAFINPLVGIGVLAGRIALKDRSGCKTADMVQRRENPTEEPGRIFTRPKGGRHR